MITNNSIIDTYNLLSYVKQTEKTQRKVVNKQIKVLPL